MTTTSAVTLVLGLTALSGAFGCRKQEATKLREEPASAQLGGGAAAGERRADVSLAIERLRSPDARDRAEAAEDLGRLGPLARPALDDLVKLLDDEDPVCVAGVRAIYAIGPSAAGAVPAIVKMARTTPGGLPDYKCWAAAEDCKSLGAAAVPYLIAELGVDPDSDEYPENMLAALDAGDTLPALLKLLDEGGARALAATEVIWRLGVKARTAAPALSGAVRSGKIPDLNFVSAIEKLEADDPAAIEQLRRIGRESKDQRTHDEAVRVLATLSRPGAQDLKKDR